MNYVNLLKVLLGYGVILLPQVYAALQAYQLQHPSPYIALLLSVLGGALLNHADVPTVRK